MAKKPEPYLYILMRTDLTTLNPGKAIAQGVHAGNQFTYRTVRDFRGDPTILRQLRAWERSVAVIRELRERVQKIGAKARPSPRDRAALAAARRKLAKVYLGFGTTICLGVTGPQLQSAVAAAEDAGLPAGVTHDPTYPVLERVRVRIAPKRKGAKPRYAYTTRLRLIPIDTCGYVFGDKRSLKPILGRFTLHP